MTCEDCTHSYHRYIGNDSCWVCELDERQHHRICDKFEPMPDVVRCVR